MDKKIREKESKGRDVKRVRIKKRGNKQNDKYAVVKERKRGSKEEGKNKRAKRKVGQTIGLLAFAFSLLLLSFVLFVFAFYSSCSCMWMEKNPIIIFHVTFPAFFVVHVIAARKLNRQSQSECSCQLSSGRKRH